MMTIDAEQFTAAELGRRDGAMLGAAVTLHDLPPASRPDLIAYATDIARQAIADVEQSLKAEGVPWPDRFVYRHAARTAFDLAIRAASGAAHSSGVH
jgi:hypothetical protein